jgi:ATP-binding cassette subfamily C protein
LSALFSLLYLYRMFAYSSSLATAGLLMILLNMGMTLLFGWLMIRHEKKLIELKAKISSVLYQIISGIAKIRISAVENRVLLNYLEVL